MELKEKISQWIYKYTEIVPHERFVLYLIIILGLLGVLLISLFVFFVYWRWTLADLPDLNHPSYVNFMQTHR